MTELTEQARRAHLAGRLKTARKLANLKVAEAAAKVGWSWQKVYRLERGDQVPTAFELDAWATLTEQPLEFFLDSTSLTGDDGTAILADPATPGQPAGAPEPRARATV